MTMDQDDDGQTLPPPPPSGSNGSRLSMAPSALDELVHDLGAKVEAVRVSVGQLADQLKDTHQLVIDTHGLIDVHMRECVAERIRTTEEISDVKEELKVITGLLTRMQST